MRTAEKNKGKYKNHPVGDFLNVKVSIIFKYESIILYIKFTGGINYGRKTISC